MIRNSHMVLEDYNGRFLEFFFNPRLYRVLTKYMKVILKMVNAMVTVASFIEMAPII